MIILGVLPFEDLERPGQAPAWPDRVLSRFGRDRAASRLGPCG